jgi:hypothetical protein
MPQWTDALTATVDPQELLFLRDRKALQRLCSPEDLAAYRFVLVNTTFLSTNHTALRDAWTTLCASLAVCEFRLRIIDEYTSKFLQAIVKPTPHRGEPVVFARSRPLEILQTMFSASATLLISATPFDDLNYQWTNQLLTMVLLGVEVSGQPLFTPPHTARMYSYLCNTVAFKPLVCTESWATVSRVFRVMDHGFFPVPPWRAHNVSLHLLLVPPSANTVQYLEHGLAVRLNGLYLSRYSVLPSRTVILDHFNKLDHYNRPAHPTFRLRVEANVAAGKPDLRQLPETTTCPLPRALMETGVNRLHMPTECPVTATELPDVWVALLRVVEAGGPGLRGLLYLKSKDAFTMAQITELMGETVPELKGNSNTMASRLKKFRQGVYPLLMVPSTHCSGMDLPMVTHIFVPYRPTDCSKADILQLVGRVRRHGSASTTRVVFIAHRMDADTDGCVARNVTGVDP